jgi:hypothetical protein
MRKRFDKSAEIDAARHQEIAKTIENHVLWHEDESRGAEERPEESAEVRLPPRTLRQRAGISIVT